MQPDFDMIGHFINIIGTRRRHHLAAIHPSRPGLHGSTYEAKQLPIMMKYIETQQRNGFGIYYSLNEGVAVYHQRGFNGKLLADEIIKVHMFGFDIDWITGSEDDRKGFEREALVLLARPDMEVYPNIIVSSGGGLQTLFVLDVPLPVALSRQKIPSTDEAVSDKVSIGYRDEISMLYRDFVLRLEKQLRTMINEGICKIDQLGNIDRVFRLPGTINYPTQAKIEKGATVRMAKIVWEGDSLYSFHDLRLAVPVITKPIERKEKVPFVENQNRTWNIYNKTRFLCEFIKDNRLVEDNENYTHSLMFPLFGMINRNELTASQGRELWLLATSTARDPANGSWTKKWDTRRIANYTGRDIGSIIHFVRKFDCLLPWSSADEMIKIDIEGKQITEDDMRNPKAGDEEELFRKF